MSRAFRAALRATCRAFTGSSVSGSCAWCSGGGQRMGAGEGIAWNGGIEATRVFFRKILNTAGGNISRNAAAGAADMARGAFCWLVIELM